MAALICDAGSEWEVFAWSLAKCSRVVDVGVGRGYVWVNVMGKKKSFPKKIKNKKGGKL